MMRELNLVQAATPALFELDSDPAGFQWINDNDWRANTFSWLRSDSRGGIVACIANFSPDPYPEYGLRVPEAGSWTEILNTDQTQWDGTGAFINGTRTAAQIPGTDQAELIISVPPMAGVWMRFDPTPTR